MRGAVDQPGEVEEQHVANHSARPDGQVPRLVPAVDGDQWRQDEAQQDLQDPEVAVNGAQFIIQIVNIVENFTSSKPKSTLTARATGRRGQPARRSGPP